ncbi:hypothetical protein GQX73_g2836 [Xylaria multiplex]|uniref:Gamma interferon inducible lysosomal thiol reductase GILT n=1 Tax=Xylaria multiplex TaxID=323545 RepID=A0A7C8J0E2_9PEZI|nr:hypothetical protein GQX73_g2836 [Xylaria multiplex]
MSEKLPVAIGHAATKRPCRLSRASFPPIGQTLLLILSLMVVYGFYTLSILGECPTQRTATATTKVPLEAHIITKCGNAKVALTELVLPTIERVYDKVDFRLSIIALFSEDGVLECKHGPGECEGSIVELCAQESYPDPRTLVGFVECLTADFERIPDRAFYEACASEHDVDLKAIDQCTSRDGGAYGRKLLRESVQHTKDVGVRISGTVRLNEEIYCIRDQGRWIDCPNGAGVDDLVGAIEELHNATIADL